MQRMIYLGGVGLLGLLLYSQVVRGDQPPQVSILALEAAPGQNANFSYVLYDPDSRALNYSLYFYPNDKLSAAEDIRTFGSLISDQRQADGEHSPGASQAPQTFTWRQTLDPQLRNWGFVPLALVLPGSYYIYLVADDGTNQPVFAVSPAPISIGDRPTALPATSWGTIKRGR